MLPNLQSHQRIANIVSKLASPVTILTIVANISPGFAQERLVPTSVDSGDCVASNISTTKTAAHRTFDRQYCTENNIGSPQKIQICRQNLAKQKQIAFFSDKCSNKGIYSIGIDGVEYQIKRQGGSLSRPPYLTGSFSGKDLRVKIEEIRSIQKSSNDGVESGKSAVSVTIIRGRNTKKIEGILVYGP